MRKTSDELREEAWREQLAEYSKDAAKPHKYGWETAPSVDLPQGYFRSVPSVPKYLFDMGKEAPHRVRVAAARMM